MTQTPYGPKWEQKYNDLQNNLIQPKWDKIKDAQEIVKSVSGNTTTTSQRYNKETGRMENVAQTTTDIPKDKFVKGWIANVGSSHHKIQEAMKETGLKDPSAAVLAQAENMYTLVGGSGKQAEKVTGAGMTMENVEKLQTHNAYVHGQYGQSNQETPFQKHAKLIQNAAVKDPKAAEALVKPLIDQINKTGLQGEIQYKVNNGTLAIDMPDKIDKSGNIVTEAHPIRVDIADPHWGDVLQAKLHQEGFDVSSFNQAYKGKQLPGVKPQSYKITEGKYKGQTIPSSVIHEKAAKFGYTDQEYIDWLHKQK